jgi:outer membrane protein assembly factor BamB
MMFRLGTLTLLFVAGLIHLATATVDAQVNLPSQQLLNRYGLEVLWSSQGVLNKSRDRVMNATIDEETVYIQSQNGFISAFDSETGDRRWAQLVGRLDSPQLPLTSNQDTVLVTSGIRLFAVDKWEGVRLWEIALAEQAGARPVSDNERVYVASQEGSVYAYDLARIYELYHANKLPKWSVQTQIWRHATSRPIKIPPILYENQLTFASKTGIMYSVRPEDDKLVFQMSTNQSISAPMVEKSGRLYVCTDANHVYCLDSLRGTVIWDFVARGPVTTQPRIVNNRCYLSTVAGTVYCLNAETGINEWESKESYKFIAKTENYVVTADRLGNLLLLSLNATGTDVTVTARLPMKSFKFKIANDLTDRIYLVSEQGQTLCLRERGNSFPKFFRNPDRRPVEPIFADENAGQNSATDDSGNN